MTGTLKDLSRVSLDEIIFEGRNQEYGAFQLRRLYAHHLKQAAVGATLFFLLVVALPVAVRYFAKDVVLPKPPTVTERWTEITLNPPKTEMVKPVAQPPTAVQPVKTTAAVPPRVVPNDQPTPQDLPTMQALNAAENLGTQTVTTGVDGPALPVETAPTTATPSAPVADTKIWDYAETPAEFEGGQKALLAFVARNFHYGGVALRNQVEGKIYVRFVVDERGNVTAANVTKGLGAGLDEEAVRVVKLLHFTPAQQNGQVVKVYMSLPINLQIR